MEISAQKRKIIVGVLGAILIGTGPLWVIAGGSVYIAMILIGFGAFMAFGIRDTKWVKPYLKQLEDFQFTKEDMMGYIEENLPQLLEKAGYSPKKPE